MEKKKEKRNMEVKVLSGMSAIKKLQLSVGLIFILFTLGIIIAFTAPKEASIAFGVGLLGYILLFFLTIKIFLVRKL